MAKRRTSGTTVLAAVLTLAGWLAAGCWCAQADLLSDLVARCPASPRSFAEVLDVLARLDDSPRCQVFQIGESAQGRPLLMAEVTDDQSPYPRATLLIIARQHGNERAGTETALALLEHYVAAPTAAEREILKYLRLVAIPVANPDGAVAERRDNARGVDLNRDWSDLSQPETQAIDAIVRQLQPDAILDLHELPAASGKPAYATNFVETIGAADGIPREVSGCTRAVTAALTAWTRTYDYPLNVYYDEGGNLDLCHRYFGLRRHFPTFLCEAKTGGGRSLRDRVGFQALCALVVANQVMHRRAAQGQGTSASPTPAASPPAATAATTPAPPSPAPPATVQVRFVPGADARGGEVLASVQGGENVSYVELTVAGRTRAISNQRDNSWSLDLAALTPGEHEMTVTAYGPGEAPLASAGLKLVVSDTQAVSAR